MESKLKKNPRLSCILNREEFSVNVIAFLEIDLTIQCYVCSKLPMNESSTVLLFLHFWEIISEKFIQSDFTILHSFRLRSLRARTT